MATVTSCRYQFGAGRATAFGLPTSRHYLITYNYWAPDFRGGTELLTGQFASERPVPQGHLFPLTYNPDHPLENSCTPHQGGESGSPAPLIALGLLASLMLALAWFALLRGAH